MSEKIVVLWTLTTVLLAACGGDPGGSTGTASQGQTSGETGAGTGSSTEPTTGAVTTGEATGGASQTGGQTTGPGVTGSSSGEVVTGSSGEPGTSGPGTGSSGEPGTSTGADLCADFEDPGCFNERGCPEGMECKVLPDECVSSACTCDPGTGMIACTPDCSGGTCVAACGPVNCNLFCEFGFKKDDMGCEICECNEPPADCGCKSDKECVKTSSGCCPCNSGGDEVPAHMNCVDQVMKCDLPPDQVNCPQVYKCTDVVPACVNGQCVLQ